MMAPVTCRWDWAPYSRVRDADGNPAFTKGIWKSVYAVSVPKSTVAIAQVTPLVYYTGGDWPTSALIDGASPFEVVVKVYLMGFADSVDGTLHVSGSWGGQLANVTTRVLNIAAGVETEVNVTLVASTPELWWPNGMGSQRLYTVTTHFVPDLGLAPTAPVVRPIGFRFVALVTGNDTNATWVAENANAEGNGDHTMMFRVNGAPFAARGANMIPSSSPLVSFFMLGNIRLHAIVFLRNQIFSRILYVSHL